MDFRYRSSYFQNTIIFSLILVTSLACNEQSIRLDRAYITKPLPVQLDNGSPWKANRETTHGIQQMQNLIVNFNSSNELDDYHSLSLQLQHEFTLIFQQCTMKGEAHNQLHNYLIPINSSFEILNSQNIDSCFQEIERLKFILDQYHQFFE